MKKTAETYRARKFFALLFVMQLFLLLGPLTASADIIVWPMATHEECYDVDRVRVTNVAERKYCWCIVEECLVWTASGNFYQLRRNRACDPWVPFGEIVEENEYSHDEIELFIGTEEETAAEAEFIY